MSITIMIKKRLDELGLEQRDLALAAQVTESYISQLLNHRRVLPAPERTDIYEKMDAVLKLPPGRLASMVTHERREELLRNIGDETLPLYPEARTHILLKCRPSRKRAVQAIFDKRAFGELERLITQTMVDILKPMVHADSEDEDRLRTALTSPEEYRVDLANQALEFLDADILHLPQKAFSDFLDLFIDSWDFDLVAFEMRVTLNGGGNGAGFRRFRFTEIFHEDRSTKEPGFIKFLAKPTLSGSATEAEIEFLRSLRFTTGRPTALYYYRELQNIRDPLHISAKPAEE